MEDADGDFEEEDLVFEVLRRVVCEEDEDEELAEDFEHVVQVEDFEHGVEVLLDVEAETGRDHVRAEHAGHVQQDHRAIGQLHASAVRVGYFEVSTCSSFLRKVNSESKMRWFRKRGRDWAEPGASLCCELLIESTRSMSSFILFRASSAN